MPEAELADNSKTLEPPPPDNGNGTSAYGLLRKLGTSLNRRGNGKAAPKPEVPVLLIQPSNGWVSLKLHELWEYRELLYFLTRRDIKVRYKQTVLGAAWAIIQPFFTIGGVSLLQ